jgi:hypothetical protein
VVADLSIPAMVLATLALIILINASQLTMIGVDLAMSGRAAALFHSLNTWLSHNNRRIAGFVGLVGAFLSWDGIRNLGIFG